jgi:GcrA cell cycle regulator
VTARSQQPAALKTLATLLPNECRWPIGDPQHADFHFCGDPKSDGTPYCAKHADKAKTPGRPRTLTFRERG